jgi:hypothetical protein
MQIILQQIFNHINYKYHQYKENYLEYFRQLQTQYNEDDIDEFSTNSYLTIPYRKTFVFEEIPFH